MFVPATTPPRLITLIYLTAISVLTLNMFLPSLANIAQDLGSSYALASFAVSGYLAVNAVMQLIVGPLADRYGRRPILLVCISIFVVASIVCAVADNIWLFLAARTVQAFIIAGATIASAVISDTAEKEKAASLMAYVGMAMAIAPMLAPMLGGFLDQAFGWRSGVWVYIGLGIFGRTRGVRYDTGDGRRRHRFNHRRLLCWHILIRAILGTHGHYVDGDGRTDRSACGIVDCAWIDPFGLHLGLCLLRWRNHRGVWQWAVRTQRTRRCFGDPASSCGQRIGPFRRIDRCDWCGFDVHAWFFADR